MRFTADELRSVGILEGLPEVQIAWFAEHGEKIELGDGEHMFARGDAADFMYIVVKGVIEGYEAVGGQELLVATTCPGQVTGMLPYSRMTHYPRYTVATQPSQVLRIRKDDFGDMLATSHEMGQRLVAQMSDRVRGDVRLEQQHEKMAALGRLSAGLAHEFNNPATAISRAAAGLGEELTGLTELVSKLVRHGMTTDHMDAIGELRRVATERSTADLSPLVRSEREECMAAWMEDQGVANAWDLAGTFADAGLTVADLDAFARDVPEELRVDALAWVACVLCVHRVFTEINSSAGRISELVDSVKVYSHMDQSPEHRPVDVREGIDKTMVLLHHSFAEKNIRLVREFPEDPPIVLAHAGELNQVWTNIVNNAIDAVSDAGEIRVEVRADDTHVSVSFVDNGHGIPEEAQNHIFEPFFTTKGVGKGTGLGLDIALRIVRGHHGTIGVVSQPGRTRVEVRLPAASV